jgi:hypothetical protein
MLACAEACRTSANFILLGSKHHPQYCRACADICDECAQVCERLGDMAECVTACRRCAESCRTMAG